MDVSDGSRHPGSCGVTVSDYASAMEQGAIPADGLQELLVEKRAFVRAALTTEGGRWVVRYIEAVAGARPSTWQEALWVYDGIVFIAEELQGDEVASALPGGEDHPLTLTAYQAVLGPVGDHVNWQRRPSRVPHDPSSLPWPTVDYSLYRQGAVDWQRPTGFLIGDDCPSFPTFDTGFRAFFYGDFSTVGPQQAPSDLGRVRVVQLDAWLQRVRVSPTHLDVQVRGTAVAGTRVELNGATYGAAKSVGKTGNVRLRLPEGLPDDAWLYLSKERRWLDYRALGPRLGGMDDPPRVGVEVELPSDPEGEIRALLSVGEGPRIEFKKALPGDGIDSKRKVLKTVAAFANGAGGSVVFGMDPDEATVVGVAEAAAAARDRLTDLIRGNVSPSPVFDFRSYDLDGKVLIVLDVDHGGSPPYGLRSHNESAAFYIRRGASTYPATSEEVRAIALASIPDQGSYGHLRRWPW